MTIPSSMRKVFLLDDRKPGRPAVEASLHRDYPVAELAHVESLWAEAREPAATAGDAAGLAPLEHSHWDWRNKADSVERRRHLLVGLECEGDPQGVMAVLRTPRLARLVSEHLVYVDDVETAPWNSKGAGLAPRFLGVGTALIAEAIRLGLEMGLGGRVGLHSLPQAEPFYLKCQMTRVGPDPDYYDLTYFEYLGQRATDWLAAAGGTQ